MPHTSIILIVDDEAGVRTTLERLLRPLGYRLALADGGVEALQLAVELLPDLILLDAAMPGMDGFEVCRRLRAVPDLAEVPVIMVTGLDDRESRIRAIEAGVDDFLTKPFDGVELRTRVRSTTRINRYRLLLDERAKFAWAVEQSDNGYLMLSRCGEIQYANPAARRFLSLPASEQAPLGETFAALTERLYRREPQDAWARWLEQPATVGPASLYLVQPELPHRRAFWLQVEVAELTAESESGWMVRLRDVTAQRALEHEIHSFQAAVNHKLRTPLVGMLGSLKLLASRAQTLTSGDVTALAGTALETAERLHDEIKDILEYLETPILAQAGGTFPLARLPSLLAAISAEIEVETQVVVGPGLADAALVCSERAVEIVFRELLENAKKFHPRHAPAVEIRALRSGAAGAGITVRDDGVTLSQEQLARVWRPYYQGESFFTGQIPGMGLGLAQVAQLLWSVGGTCRIANRDDGSGIVVELSIPTTQGAEPAAGD